MTEAAHAVNCYVCPRSHKTWTWNRDPGVTPFLLGCQTPGCTELAQSSFYRVIQVRRGPWAWVRPTPEELEGYARHFADHCAHHDLDARETWPPITEHLREGGLLLARLAPDGTVAGWKE